MALQATEAWAPVQRGRCSGRLRELGGVLVRITVLVEIRPRLAGLGLIHGIRNRPGRLALVHYGVLPNLAGAGGLIDQQLTTVLQQAFDVGLDRSQAGGLLLLSLPGLLTQGMQLSLQRLKALFHGHQALGEGMDGFGQILGMAADPERHRGAGHRGTERVAA